jgi:DtxR family Mn-dependent transcriptional regulator
VNYDPYQLITLTDRGRQAAEAVRDRHQVLRRFLTEVLALEEPVAEANACRMEHAVDDRAMGRLSEFVDFVNRCRRRGHDWVASFHPHRARSRPRTARGGRASTPRRGRA